MIQLHVCPSTLAEGFDTYSPSARKILFDGLKVSHCLSFPSPASDAREAKEAVKNAGRISLSGAQPKFSMVIGENLSLRYTVESEQGTYILKPRPNGYQLMNKEYCAANEHLTMQIASQAYNIETAANGLCFFLDDEPAYITRRFDVYSGGKYQQEDFASLMGYTKANGGSDYKYCNGSYEECAEIIARFVKASRIDILRFFRLVLFNFISLNDDAHLKNFSLVNRGKEYRLSPAYDLINTSLHLYEPRIFALDKGLFREGMVTDDTHSVGYKEFLEFGKRIGIPENMAKRELERFSKDNPLVDSLIDRSFLSAPLKKQYRLSMNYRRKMLTF
ncbi:HipA domain-containing protein [Bacteroides sp. An19]|uniref:HipA domain-containing protein n=1 Tax=Bacteroides sp. An19 TaxID=1965580 RepID=UPI000B36577A|nr:HipA domain-containing protein [Bacteroides sp. An19]OUP30516.1 toxin HipA [Bacteroides sp. An19]